MLNTIRPGQIYGWYGELLEVNMGWSNLRLVMVWGSALGELGQGGSTGTTGDGAVWGSRKHVPVI